MYIGSISKWSSPPLARYVQHDNPPSYELLHWLLLGQSQQTWSFLPRTREKMPHLQPNDYLLQSSPGGSFSTYKLQLPQFFNLPCLSSSIYIRSCYNVQCLDLPDSEASKHLPPEGGVQIRPKSPIWLYLLWDFFAFVLCLCSKHKPGKRTHLAEILFKTVGPYVFFRIVLPLVQIHADMEDPKSMGLTRWHRGAWKHESMHLQ